MRSGSKIFCGVMLAGAGWVLALLLPGAVVGAPALEPGVSALFRSAAGGGDAMVLPNFWFYSAEGEPPTPFLSAGDYELRMEAFVSVDLRGQYALQAELNGSITAEVNGREVLEAATNGVTGRSKPFRLNKGTNSLALRFTPPKSGDARLRLSWVPRNSFPAPIPPERLSHLPAAELDAGASLRRGRTLLAELRCLQCHAADTSIPDLRMDAPAFTGIGNRLRPGWMAQWIENPKHLLAEARMPRLLHGAEAGEKAQSIAAYLASLKVTPPGPLRSAPGDAAEGAELFAALRCAACHHHEGAPSSESGSLPLSHVGNKFLPGALKDYLLNPHAHFTWSRMPDFKLSQEEAEHLAAFLLASSAPPDDPPPSPATHLERGKKLLQVTGCLNCHALELDNGHAAAPLEQLAGFTEGCLAPPGGTQGAPDFALNATERAALAHLLASQLPALERDDAREFALRHTSLLNCSACHAKGEPFTEFALLGEKLKPEWAAAFIGGNLPYKPRPWLRARMPSFPTRADPLAGGLAMLHGFPPSTPLEPPLDPALAEAGRKLVGAEGGFSCTACHAAGAGATGQIFESPGINFAWVGERLRPDFHHRWLLNPLAIDPATKMPVYFDAEGRSPLTDVFGGNATRQIEAIWQYLRLGRDLPPPQ